MSVLVTNNAAATISMVGGFNSSATALTVGSGQGAQFPAVLSSDANYFYVTLIDGGGNLEIVKCPHRSGDSLTVVRAQDNTAARTFSNGDGVELRLTAAVMQEIAGSRVNGIETSTEIQVSTPGVTYPANYDIGFVQVYKNGVRLDSTDYTATDGSSITLGQSTSAGDVLYFQAFGSFIIANTYTKTEVDAIAVDVEDIIEEYHLLGL